MADLAGSARGGAGPTSMAWPPSREALLVPGVLALLLALRCAIVLSSGAGLHVDEAQYWDWSRSLQWGYFSKPPMIAALIAASTALFGDGVLGVRALAMACWLLASVVMWRLGHAMGGPAAGRSAALLLAATPASGLLGLVATTDAPLVLCWSLLMAATWRALQGDGDHPGRWAVAGLALGAGLLAKYTMAAALLSWALLAPWPLRPRRCLGLALAVLLGAALLAPNLAWNAAHGWPTLRHTAEITATASRPGGQGIVSSVAEYLGGQLLLAGPLLVGTAWWAWRRGRKAGHVVPGGAPIAPERFALAFTWPLLALGLLQALNSRTQMNWTAPALLGLSLWTALRLQRSGLSSRSLLTLTVAGVALCSALALAGDLRRTVAPSAAGRSWDLWARMRGWDPALNSLRPALDARAGRPVFGTERALIVHAAYAWRDGGPRVHALPRHGAPQHHYELAGQPGSATDAQRCAPSWLLLSRATPDPAVFAGASRVERVAEARSGAVELALWQVTPAPGAPCLGSGP